MHKEKQQHCTQSNTFHLQFKTPMSHLRCQSFYNEAPFPVALTGWGQFLRGRVKGHGPHLDTNVTTRPSDTCAINTGSRPGWIFPPHFHIPSWTGDHTSQSQQMEMNAKHSVRRSNQTRPQRRVPALTSPTTSPCLSEGSEGKCCHMVGIVHLMTDGWAQELTSDSGDQSDTLEAHHCANTRTREPASRSTRASGGRSRSFTFSFFPPSIIVIFVRMCLLAYLKSFTCVIMLYLRVRLSLCLLCSMSTCWIYDYNLYL